MCRSGRNYPRSNERSIAAGGQEAFVGFLEHTDAQLGRLVSWLEQTGQLDNTMIVVLSDNGAAGDGRDFGTTNVLGPYNNLALDADSETAGLPFIGDHTHPTHYATGWAMAGNTPFRRYKQYVDLGGTRSPLIVHWPGVAPAGEVRSQFAHVIDLAATFVDTALDREDDDRFDIIAALDGASMHTMIADDAAPPARQTQYFEMLGHRGIWHNGWRAVTQHQKGTPYDQDQWRLYDLERDFAETTDIADEQPDKLKALTELWWDEAAKNSVLPLDDRSLKELLEARGGSARALMRKIVLRPGQSHLSFTTRLTGTNRTMRVSARLTRTGTENGVLLASRAGYGGYVLFVRDNFLHFEHHMLSERVAVASSTPVPAGKSTVGFFSQRGPGRVADVRLFGQSPIIGPTFVDLTDLYSALLRARARGGRNAR